jgi:hypothetical protein
MVRLDPAAGIPDTPVMNGGTTTPPENRLLVPDAPRTSTSRRDREHGETEPDHHHSNEFEDKNIHGNSPRVNR